MSVRVRYAPSPTGRLHVGNLRAALFDFLLAKRHGGTSILRIEDTDRTRYSAEAEDYQYEAMKWCGIEFDESPQKGGSSAPYRQSERKEAGIYAPTIKRLLDEGLAYKAFDTSQELDDMREYQQINKQQVGYYGGIWRDASPEQVAEAEAAGKPHVIRLKMPRDVTIKLQDKVRGLIEWNSSDIDDPVLIKADGMPTYHFAAMVDDHLMNITHIIRGDEWISSAPKHAWLFDCLGWDRPQFVHVPIIKGKDGKKLSKRHGSTSVLDYKALGYLPEALVNFIALIGWSPKGDREILPLPELIEAFDLDGIQPSPGVFDIDKLRWLNGQYIRMMDLDVLMATVKQFADDPDVLAVYETEDEEMPHGDPRAYLKLLVEGLERYPELGREAIKLEQERVVTLADFGEATAFFFQDEVPMDPKATEKWFGQAHVRPMLESFKSQLGAHEKVTVEFCEAMVRGYATEHGIEKLGPVVHPTRVALTGKTAGPGLFELMAALGPARMISRFERALGMLP